MAQFRIKHVEINGIAAAVPKNIAKNTELNFYRDVELNKLIATIGIHNRRIALPHQCASDLCKAAAEKLIEGLNWNKSEIDLLVFVSQTPDFQLPGSSMQIQHQLGLKKACLAIDINQGCAGYVYGLSVITALMSAGQLKKGLLLVGDTITKNISEFDSSLIPLFSDAGTATALSYNEDAEAIAFNTSSEGEKYDSIIIPEGGSRIPFSTASNDYKYVENGIKRKGHHLQMKGLDVFNFSLNKVVPNVEELLNYARLDKGAIDKYVFHQPNLLILKTLAKKLSIPFEKVPVSLKEYGNTSSASVPLTIVTEVAVNNRIINQNILLCGFGVGLSLGSAVLKFKDVYCAEIIEM